MVGFPIEYICSVIFRTFFIDDLEVEFIEEFWSLYLSLVEIFRDSEINEVFVVYINFYLMFSSIKVKFLLFEWFDINH